MAEAQKGDRKRGPGGVIRPVVLLLVLGGIAFTLWKYTHRREDYVGGDVLTTGTVEAVHVRLGFKVGGRIAEVAVGEGTRVAAGALLARLERPDFDVQVHAAEAALAAGQAAVAQARAGRSKAVSDLARMRSLIEGGAGTPQQLDATRAAADIAAAQVESAQAQVQQAQAALEQARLQRSYTELRSPQAGEVSEQTHYAGETVLPGTTVLTVAQYDTVKVLAAVDETRVGAVRPGDSVEVKVYTFDNRVFPGTVSAVQTAGDFATRKDWGAQRRDIRTFDVTVRVPNPDRLLKDGMTADVRIKVSDAVRRMVGGKP